MQRVLLPLLLVLAATDEAVPTTSSPSSPATTPNSRGTTTSATTAQSSSSSSSTTTTTTPLSSSSSSAVLPTSTSTSTTTPSGPVDGSRCVARGLALSRGAVGVAAQEVVSAWTACSDLCQQVNGAASSSSTSVVGCRYFSWDSDDQVCVVSGSVQPSWEVNLLAAAQPAVCATSSSTVHAEPGVSYTAAELKDFSPEAVGRVATQQRQAPTPWACAELCRAATSSSCVAAQFDVKSHACQLLSNVAMAATTDENLIVLHMDAAVALESGSNNNGEGGTGEEEKGCEFVIPKGATVKVVTPTFGDTPLPPSALSLDSTPTGTAIAPIGALLQFSCNSAGDLLLPGGELLRQFLMCGPRGWLTGILPACMAKKKTVTVFTDPKYVENKWLAEVLPSWRKVLGPALLRERPALGSASTVAVSLSGASVAVVPPGTAGDVLARTGQAELRAWIENGGLLMVEENGGGAVLAATAGAATPAGIPATGCSTAQASLPGAALGSAVDVSAAVGRVTRLVSCSSGTAAALTIRKGSGAALWMKVAPLVRGHDAALHAIAQLAGSVKDQQRLPIGATCAAAGGVRGVGTQCCTALEGGSKGLCPADLVAPDAEVGDCLNVKAPCLSAVVEGSEAESCTVFNSNYETDVELKNGEVFQLSCYEEFGAPDVFMVNGTKVLAGAQAKCADDGLSVRVSVDGRQAPADVTPKDFLCVDSKMRGYVVGQRGPLAMASLLGRLHLSPADSSLAVESVAIGVAVLPSSLHAVALSRALATQLLRFAWNGGVILDLSGTLSAFLIHSNGAGDTGAVSVVAPELAYCSLERAPVTRDAQWQTAVANQARDLENSVASVELWKQLAAAIGAVTPQVVTVAADLSPVEAIPLLRSRKLTVEDLSSFEWPRETRARETEAQEPSSGRNISLHGVPGGMQGRILAAAGSGADRDKIVGDAPKNMKEEEEMKTKTTELSDDKSKVDGDNEDDDDDDDGRTDSIGNASTSAAVVGGSSTSGAQQQQQLLTLEDLVVEAGRTVALTECMSTTYGKLYATAVTPIGKGAVIGDTLLRQSRQLMESRLGSAEETSAVLPAGYAEHLALLFTAVSILAPVTPVTLHVTADSAILDGDVPCEDCAPAVIDSSDNGNQRRRAMGLGFGLGGAAVVAAGTGLIVAKRRRKTTGPVKDDDLDSVDDGGEGVVWDEVNMVTIHSTGDSKENVVQDEIRRLRDEMAMLRTQVEQPPNRNTVNLAAAVGDIARPRPMGAAGNGLRRYSVTGTIHRTCSVHRLGISPETPPRRMAKDPKTPDTTIRLSDLDLQPLPAMTGNPLRDRSLLDVSADDVAALPARQQQRGGFVARPKASVRGTKQ